MRTPRTGFSTSGKRNTQPWQMEPYGDHYLLYPGGIYDEELLAENRNDSVSPRALPVMTSNAGKSTTSTLGSANAAPGRTGLKGNTPVIYWKRDKGQATIDDRESHGIIPYRKGLFYHGAYVVLSRTTSEENNYWSLSVFKKSDYVPNPKDIIIAYGFKNTIQNIWSSDVHYNKTTVTGNPFEVKFLGIDNDEQSENYEKAMYSVVPGTVNNEIPFVGDDYMDITPSPVIYADDSGFIILNVTKNEDSQYPSPYDITFETELLDNTNEDGYLVLASITKTPEDPETNTPASFNHFSYINGSIICYRVRVGDETAVYYWSTI